MIKIINDTKLIEDELNKHGTYASTTRGMSMEPLFRTGRDVVYITVPGGELRKYDVALYRGPNGNYVMHRVIKVLRDEYIIRGDNTFFLEHVPKDGVIGVLSSFNRKGKLYNADSRSHRIYAALWNFIYPIRYVYHVLRRLAGKVYRTLFKTRA